MDCTVVVDAGVVVVAAGGVADLVAGDDDAADDIAVGDGAGCVLTVVGRDGGDEAVVDGCIAGRSD